MYSIFGVDDYSFIPYKVAISGLYKQTKFTLVKPNGTVLLLDDTCYFIGFDTLEEAQNIQNLLNQPEIQEFIESFMFIDEKRAITKELLMRIGFTNLSSEPLRYPPPAASCHHVICHFGKVRCAREIYDKFRRNYKEFKKSEN